MSVSIDNSQPFDPTKLGLPPPKSSGDQYANLVSRPGGPPLGEGDNTVKKGTAKATGEPSSIQDVLEEIKLAEANLPPELLGLNFGISMKSIGIMAQNQLDTLDPTNPSVPILLKYIQIVQNFELASGDLVGALGTQGAQKLAERQKIAVGDNDAKVAGAANVQANAATANDPVGAANVQSSAVAATSSAANPWLSGNSYVAFQINYWLMLKALKEMKEVEGKTQVASLDMMVELAKDTAEAILDAAETRFWEHIAMAIVDAVSVGITIGFTVASVASTMKMKAEVGDADGSGFKSSKAIKVRNMKLQAISQGFEGLSRATQSAEKSADNIIQGVLELKAAQYDALKEILQTYRQMQQMQADRALESFKQNTEMIAQLIQQLDQMRSKIMEAQAKALSRSST